MKPGDSVYYNAQDGKQLNAKVLAVHGDTNLPVLDLDIEGIGEQTDVPFGLCIEGCWEKRK